MTRVILLHGLRRTPADWDAVRAGLEPRFPTAAPALPPGAAPALATAARAVEPGDVAIGHSLGALVALRLVAERGIALRGIVLTGCVFPPARNGRSLPRTVLDQAGHRVALLREARRDLPAARPERSLRALGALMRRAATGADVPPTGAVPVLVMHARDDHHVAADFAIAACASHPTFELRLLDRGGHHVHVREPGRWLAEVAPWLRQISPGGDHDTIANASLPPLRGSASGCRRSDP